MAGKHTAGPWRVIPREVQDDGSVYPAHIVGGPLNNTVCPLEAGCVAEIAAQQPGSHWDTTQTKEANARLIAAAPDLLEALELIVRLRRDALNDSLLSMNAEHPTLLEYAEAAITRATQPLPTMSEEES